MLGHVGGVVKRCDPLSAKRALLNWLAWQQVLSPSAGNIIRSRCISGSAICHFSQAGAASTFRACGSGRITITFAF